jgi:hypothetical protein
MMIDKSIVLLQDCMDLQKDMEGSCSETCATSRDAHQIISIKVEDVSDIEEEKDPVPLRYSRIKVEPAVSLCLCVTVRQNLQIYKIACFSHFHLSVCPYETTVFG